jgi:fructose-1,6-bisphosphatase I
MLRLPNDGAPMGLPLDDYLADKGPLAAIVDAIARAVPPLADRLAAGRIHGDPTEIVGTNDSGDRQKALDVVAHDHMLAALRAAGVRWVLLEEDRDVVGPEPGRRLGLGD